MKFSAIAAAAAMSLIAGMASATTITPEFIGKYDDSKVDTESWGFVIESRVKVDDRWKTIKTTYKTPKLLFAEMDKDCADTQTYSSSSRGGGGCQSYIYSFDETGVYGNKDQRKAYEDAFVITSSDGKSGTWSFTFNDILPIGPSYVLFETDDDFYVYGLGSYVLGTDLLANWDIGDKLKKVYFYDTGVPPVVNEVPLPAAGWLLLAGFGGLAAMRRKKNAA